MTRTAGNLCAAGLEECQYNTLLEPSEAVDSLLTTIVSVQDASNLFHYGEHDNYLSMRTALPRPEARAGRSIIISLSSFNSFAPLQVTKEDLKQLVIDEDIDPGFATIVASFGRLPRSSEQGYSCASSKVHEDGSYTTSYLLRFAEQDSENNWKIRQLGVYHSYCKSNDSHFWILVHSHPPQDDTLARKLMDHFATAEGRTWFNTCPVLLHAFILDTYIPRWRWYLDSLGESYGDLSHNIGTVSLQHAYECRVTLASLQKCKRLLERMAAIPAILDASLRITSSMTTVQDGPTSKKLSMAISLHRQSLFDLKSSTDVLVRQTQGLVELLGNTLDLKNQQDAALVNQHLLKLSLRTAKDSITIRVITLVTLFYLPATFVATLFGMSFFRFDNPSGNIIISHDIWIYFVAFAALTGVTLLGWWVWTKVAVKDKNLSVDVLDDGKV